MPAVARKLSRGLQDALLVCKSLAGPDHAGPHAPDKAANGILLRAIQFFKVAVDLRSSVHQQQMRAFPTIDCQARIKRRGRFQTARVVKSIDKALQGLFLFMKGGQKIFIGVQHSAVKVGQCKRAPHAWRQKYDDK